MAVPTSGELSMLKLAREKKYDNYNSTSSITAPISLYDLFIGGNTKGSGENFEATNVNGVNYPKPVTESQYLQGIDMPMGMAEWYGYDHDFGVGCGTLYTFTVYKQLSQPTCDTSKGQSVYINSSTWHTATQMYYGNINSCTPAIAGWYHYPGNTQGGYDVRYWSGSAFTSNSGCL
jgi:hypothetical protein